VSLPIRLDPLRIAALEQRVKDTYFGYDVPSCSDFSRDVGDLLKERAVWIAHDLEVMRYITRLERENRRLKSELSGLKKGKPT
jgi:hypothetical protein